METINRIIYITGIPNLISSLLLVGIVVVKIIQIFRSQYPEKISLIWIWLLGLISFLFGYLGQVTSMRNAFDAIEIAGDISPSLVAGGITGAMNYSVYGIYVLIISLIIWGILKSVIKVRSGV